MSICVRCGQPLDASAIASPQGPVHAACAQQQGYAPTAGYGAPPPYGYAPQGYGGPVTPGFDGAYSEADVLPTWWLWLLYGTIPVCFIHGVVAMVARVLYWTWRSTYPNKAATLRKHQLISSLIAFVLYASLWGLLQLATGGN